MKLIPIDPGNRVKDPAFLIEKCEEMYSVYTDYYQKNGFHLPWVGYFIFNEGIVKGVCGFTGAPAEGKVEIAYNTFEDYQGTGVAKKAGLLLTDIVKQQDVKYKVFAKTAPELNASTKILEGLGFIKKGVVQDHEIGDAWMWEF